MPPIGNDLMPDILAKQDAFRAEKYLQIQQVKQEKIVSPFLPSI